MTTATSKWALKSLGDVAAKVPYAIVDGPFGSDMKSSDYVASGVPVLQGKNITNDSFRWFDIRYLSNEKAIELKRSSVRVDDILLVKIGSIGYAAVIDSLGGHDYAIIPANLAKITPDKDLIDTRYLFRWLTSPDAKQYFQSNASKTAQPALSLGKIKALPIPVPPLLEQRRLAAILDQADALRAKRREALVQLDRLTQSIFIEMFGDPATNSLNLPLVTLGELGTWRSGGTPPRASKAYFEGDVPWFSSGELESIYVFDSKEHISDAAIKETSARPVPSGALMLGMYDTAALKASISQVNCSCNQAIAFAKINPNLAETVYVYYAIIVGREHFRRLQRGVRQKNLNLQMIREIEIPAPTISTQRVFINRVQAIEKTKKVQQSALAALDALFLAVQNRAFRGEL